MVYQGRTFPVKCKNIFDKDNMGNIPEADRIYNLSAYKKLTVKDLGTFYTMELKDNIKDLIKSGDVCWCKKTSEKSAKELFRDLRKELEEGKIYEIHPFHPTPDIHPNLTTPPLIEEKQRGVKKGDTRGEYKKKRKAIKDKNEITATCLMCERDFTYKRKGKRKRLFCKDACKQKYYRKKREEKEIRRREGLLWNCYILRV